MFRPRGRSGVGRRSDSSAGCHVNRRCHPNGRTRYDLRDEGLVWTLGADGSAIAWSESGDAPSRETALLLNEFRFADQRTHGPGALHAEHVVRGLAIAGAALPHVVHPTEVQLLRVEADGSLVFHAYDREERIAAGPPPSRESAPPRGSFGCRYFFLSYGSCLRREIAIVVHEVFVVERASLASKRGEPPWGSRELERWFGGGV